MLVFEERRKPEYPEKKPLGAKERTNNKQPTYGGEASALTFAPLLLPITIGLLRVLNPISFSHVIYPLDNGIQRLNI